jgi:hypothetical protein
VLQKHYITLALPPRNLDPSLGVATSPPSLRSYATKSRAQIREGNPGEEIKRRSYNNRQIPRQIMWIGQRNQMMQGLLPRNTLAMVQTHLRRISLTLQSKRNHFLGPLSPLYRLQCRMARSPVSRLVGCVFSRFGSWCSLTRNQGSYLPLSTISRSTDIRRSYSTIGVVTNARAVTETRTKGTPVFFLSEFLACGADVHAIQSSHSAFICLTRPTPVRRTQLRTPLVTELQCSRSVIGSGFHLRRTVTSSS